MTYYHILLSILLYMFEWWKANVKYENRLSHRELSSPHYADPFLAHHQTLKNFTLLSIMTHYQIILSTLVCSQIQQSFSWHMNTFHFHSLYTLTFHFQSWHITTISTFVCSHRQLSYPVHSHPDTFTPFTYNHDTFLYYSLNSCIFSRSIFNPVTS